MRTEVRADLTASSYLWRTLVWPAIASKIRGGQLMSLEHLTNCEVAKALDVYAGIDGFQVHHELGLRGLAHRAQVVGNQKPYDTFTIRSARENGSTTELAKRIAAMENDSGGWLFPALTIQTYAKTWDGPLVSIGIAKTTDVLHFIQMGYALTRQVRHNGSAEFKVCGWQAMQQRGYDVAVIRLDQRQPPQAELFDIAKRY